MKDHLFLFLDLICLCLQASHCLPFVLVFHFIAFTRFSDYQRKLCSLIANEIIMGNSVPLCMSAAWTNNKMQFKGRLLYTYF